jgi:hypothetical protein
MSDEMTYYQGMPLQITLRDYFAAAALTGILANYRNIADAAECAKFAYKRADAMIEAREK